MHDTGQGQQFTIGEQVTCRDGACGELRRVVIDPVARRVTHLVVEAPHRRGGGRLVPIALAESTAHGLRLRCTTSEFDAFEDAEETQFLPGSDGRFDAYEPGEMHSWPYYGLGPGGMGMGGSGGLGVGLGGGYGPQAIATDRVPLGEVEVRRGDHVHATDGEIGRVQGLVIDPADHHVTHVLLDEGHLWGKRRIALPIRDVVRVDDGVVLSLTKEEVRDLPSIALRDDH